MHLRVARLLGEVKLLESTQPPRNWSPSPATKAAVYCLNLLSASFTAGEELTRGENSRTARNCFELAPCAWPRSGTTSRQTSLFQARADAFGTRKLASPGPVAADATASHRTDVPQPPTGTQIAFFAVLSAGLAYVPAAGR